MATTMDEYRTTTAKIYNYQGQKIVVTKIDGGIFYYENGFDGQAVGYTRDLIKGNDELKCLL